MILSVSIIKWLAANYVQQHECCRASEEQKTERRHYHILDCFWWILHKYT